MKMKRLLTTLVLLFITILSYSQVPFKVYGDLHEFQNYKWFKKPKPMKTSTTMSDTIVMLYKNQLYGVKISNLASSPDSLYIKYDSLRLADSSGWVIIGDTIVIDTCSTSPFKGCDTSSYNPETNVLTICDSVYTLTFYDLWELKNSGPIEWINPKNNLSRNVGIGTNATDAKLAVSPNGKYGISAMGATTWPMVVIKNNTGTLIEGTNWSGYGVNILSHGGTAGVFESNGGSGLAAGNTSNFPTLDLNNRKAYQVIRANQNNGYGQFNIKPFFELTRKTSGATSKKEPFIQCIDTNVIIGTTDSYWQKFGFYYTNTTDTIWKYSMSYDGNTSQAGQAVIDDDGTPTTIYGGGMVLNTPDIGGNFSANITYNMASDTSWFLRLGTGTKQINIVEDTNHNGTIELSANTTQINNYVKIGIPIDSNMAIFERNGYLHFVGDARPWEDLQFPFDLSHRGSNSYPTFNQDSIYYTFTVDSTSASKCIMYYVIQMPHKWAEGTKIYPHVHYKHETGVGTPKFIMKYKWYNVGGTTATGWKWYRMDKTSGIDDKTHQMSYGLNGIDGTGKGISSIIVFQLYLRDTPSNVNAWQFDIHYQIDALGSRTETSK